MSSRIFELLDAGGNVTNRIIADPAFMAVQYPAGRYRDAGAAVAALPQIVVTGIAADADHVAGTLVSSMAEATCTAGTTLSITAELRDREGAVLPLSDGFRMPIKSRDGREKVLLAKMTAGRISITAPMRDSGVWQVTQDSINESLPDAARMSFAGITIFVVEG